MNRERLTIARDFLLTAPIADRFNLATWAGSRDIPWLGDPQLSCGTSACAAGWLTTLNEFYDSGLRLIFSETSWEASLVYLTSDDAYWGMKALMEFFDLNRSEIENIFSESSYPPNPTPQDVARKMTVLLEAA